MAFISVLFPAPLVPINPTISLSPTSNETSCTAVLPPNRTVMLFTASTGTPAGAGARSVARTEWASVFFSMAGAGPLRRATPRRSASRAE